MLEGLPSLFYHSFQLVLIKKVVFVLVVEREQACPVKGARLLNGQLLEVLMQLLDVVELKNTAVVLNNIVNSALDLVYSTKTGEADLELITLEVLIHMSESWILELEYGIGLFLPQPLGIRKSHCLSHKLIDLKLIPRVEKVNRESKLRKILSCYQPLEILLEAH